MKVTRAIHHTLFIAAFICLIMCPTVHELGDNVRHDVVFKGGAKTLQRSLQKGGIATPSPLPHTIQTAFYLQSQTAQELLLIASFHTALHLSVLSSVRLIL